MNIIVPLMVAGAALTPPALPAQSGSYSASYTNVSASGGSSASASVHTTMTGNNSGGTSVVDVETSSDGQTRTEHYESTAPSGAGMVISVTATPGGAVVSTSTAEPSSWQHGAAPVPQHAGEASTLMFEASSSASTTPHAVALPVSFTQLVTQGVFGHLSSFFSSIWSFFKR